MKNAFQVRNPDFDLSPLTGMTRKHYIECATYVLERAFKHVKSFDSPIVFPLVPGKSYPQPNNPEWRTRSHEFEALERTFKADHEASVVGVWPQYPQPSFVGNGGFFISQPNGI